MAKLSQKAEHNFVGTKCGIMDQFTSMMGSAQQVIKLDCRDLSYEYVRLDEIKAMQRQLILPLNLVVVEN